MVAGLSSKNFLCTCLPEAYRFRMSDLSDECHNSKGNQIWCPDLQGPCVEAKKTSYAAVYCSGKMHCDYLLLPNNVSGVCEEQGPGYRVPEVSPSGQFTNNFLECTYDETNNLWIWQKG